MMGIVNKEWNHRWLTPKAKVYKSAIHGIGLIAIAPIAKGEIVQVVGGIVVPRSRIIQYRKTMGHIGIQIHDDFWLAPRNRKEIGKTGAPNHSCRPNIGFEDSNIYVAMRKINANEELVIDYAFMESDFEPFKCRCDSLGCRGVITKDDWKIKELQKKYGKYFSRYLQKKIM